MTEHAIVEGNLVDVPIALIPHESETGDRAIARSLSTYRAINRLVDTAFEPKIDFDKLPGTDKDTLLLPGMEKVMGLLGLREEYIDLHAVRQFDPEQPFFYYEVECVLYSIQTGQEVARGQGVCHTREKSFMSNSKVCPSCGEAAIMRSKFGNKGWYCNPKQGGCGSNFDYNEGGIKDQQGNTFNAQLVWDGINRARKIGNKRALASAIKRVGMLSGRFTTDIEDFVEPTADAPSDPPPPSTNTRRQYDSNQPRRMGDAPQGDHWTADRDGKAAAFLDKAIDLGLGETRKDAWDYINKHYKPSGILGGMSHIKDDYDKAVARLSELADALKNEVGATDNGAGQVKKDQPSFTTLFTALWPNRTMKQFENILEAPLSDYSTTAQALADCVDIAIDQGWRVTVDTVEYNNRKQLIFHLPEGVVLKNKQGYPQPLTAFGGRTQMRKWLGSDVYDAQGIDDWEPGSVNTLAPVSILIERNEKDGTVYLNVTDCQPADADDTPTPVSADASNDDIPF